MATRIQLRRDNTADWATADPVLAAGEVAAEFDDTTGAVLSVRVGDGTTPWSSLPPFGTHRAVLAADTAPVNNSTVLTDTGLAVPVAANNARPFTAFVIYSSSTTANIQFDLTGPDGSSIDVLVVGEDDNTAAGAGVGTHQAVQLVGTIRTVAAGGELELQFAQATADASDTVVHEGSHLLLH